MTATRSYSKSADEVLLDELATLMGVVNLLGAEADSENTNAQRVVWIPDDWGTTTKVAVQPTDGHAIAQHDRVYQVALYSETYGALVELYHALRRALDARLSLQAFELGRGKPKGGSGGWGILFPVTLKGPIYAEVYGGTVLLTTTQTLSTTDAEGQNAEALT